MMSGKLGKKILPNFFTIRVFEVLFDGAANCFKWVYNFNCGAALPVADYSMELLGAFLAVRR